MSFLDNVTEHQREVIVSLPYRVGLWVSSSDSSGGEDSSQLELQALSNIIHGFAEEMFGSEVMQQIISETITKKNMWSQWAGQVDSVPSDCQMAVDVLKERVEPKDVNVFRNHLMEIGEAVAMAFREDHNNGFMARALKYIAFMLDSGQKTGNKRKKTFEEFLRISVSEHKALNTLAQSLGTTY